MKGEPANHVWLQSANDKKLTGEIGFYVRPNPPTSDGPPAPSERAGELRCPLPGIFGGIDIAALPPAIAEFDASPAAAGIPHSFVMYMRVGHGFFDREAASRPGDAADAWDRIQGFIRDVEAGRTSGLVPYLEIGRPQAPAATSPDLPPPVRASPIKGKDARPPSRPLVVP